MVHDLGHQDFKLRNCGTYEVLLGTELILRDLSCALFVEIGCLDLVLQLLELVGLGAYLFDFPLLALVDDLHFGHFLRQFHLHGVEVNRRIIVLEDLLVYWVKSC